MPDMPRLTVLICTHNREQLLSNALHWINRAARPDNWSVEILVAANACTDGTHALLHRYQESREENGGLPLKWIAVPTPGKTHALNAALAQTDTDMVAFVDDDHRIDSNYLVAVCAAAEQHPETGMFCGRILPDWDGTEPQWVHDQGPYRIYPLPVPRFELDRAAGPIDANIAIPGGGNLAIRPEIFSVVGPFNHEYGPKGHDLQGGEDSEWVLRALSKGIELRYNPDMVQYHYVDGRRLTLSYLLRKAYRRSASMVRFSGNAQHYRLFPAYLLRKVLGYAGRFVISPNQQQRRFYLVRLSAALGEIAGHLSWNANDHPASREPTE